MPTELQDRAEQLITGTLGEANVDHVSFGHCDLRTIAVYLRRDFSVPMERLRELSMVLGTEDIDLVGMKNYASEDTDPGGFDQAHLMIRHCSWPPAL